ncbi:translation initiation factor 3 complex subunit L, partial [Baffinella frigidus]
EVFLMLYRELYHRHLYLKLGAALTIEQRIESWDNYLKLFDWLFSDDDETQEIDLPAQWLWDMIDEFVYQSHEFCRYRTKDLKKRTPAELEVLEGEKHVWDTMQVMQTLQRMISRSEINRILSEDKADPAAGKLHSALTLEVGIVNVQYILGYFSLVCMSRLHVSVGDFRTALKSIEGLDFAGAVSDKVPLYMRVTSCYITLYYMIGFSYMMMRRYTDAIRTLTQLIVYLSRTQHLARPYQVEQHTKRADQMLKLVAMCVSLCPQRAVDDIIMAKLQSTYPDQLVRLGKGEENMFEEFFRNAAPKSIYPCVPNYKDQDTRVMSQTLNQQWNTLLQDIRQQHRLPMLRSYLRLYSSISTAKLAVFADGMPEDELRCHILCLKHKTTGLVKDWQSSSQAQPPMAGIVESSSNVDFYVTKGVVHVAETRVAPTFVPYFVKNINKLEKLLKDLRA